MTVVFDRAFRHRENYARMSYFSEALKSEKFKFETRTTEDYGRTLDDYEVLNNFVKKIDVIKKSEMSEWRALSDTSSLEKKN